MHPAINELAQFGRDWREFKERVRHLEELVGPPQDLEGSCHWLIAQISKLDEQRSPSTDSPSGVRREVWLSPMVKTCLVSVYERSKGVIELSSRERHGGYSVERLSEIRRLLLVMLNPGSDLNPSDWTILRTLAKEGTGHRFSGTVICDLLPKARGMRFPRGTVNNRLHHLVKAGYIDHQRKGAAAARGYALTERAWATLKSIKSV